MRRLAVAALVLAPAAAAEAQAAPSAQPPMNHGAMTPQPGARRNALSPRDTARGTVGGVQVTVDYSRPSLRGRPVFAASGLAPVGQVWRTGADKSTTLVTSGDLLVGSTRLPAGTYSLYSLPGADTWELVINRQTGQWGTVYNQSQDLARVPMTVSRLGAPVEQFTIAVEGGQLVMRWGTRQGAVALRPAGR